MTKPFFFTAVLIISTSVNFCTGQLLQQKIIPNFYNETTLRICFDNYSSILACPRQPLVPCKASNSFQVMDDSKSNKDLLSPTMMVNDRYLLRCVKVGNVFFNKKCHSTSSFGKKVLRSQAIEPILQNVSESQCKEICLTKSFECLAVSYNSISRECILTNVYEPNYLSDETNVLIKFHCQDNGKTIINFKQEYNLTIGRITWSEFQNERINAPAMWFVNNKELTKSDCKRLCLEKPGCKAIDYHSTACWLFDVDFPRIHRNLCLTMIMSIDFNPPFLLKPTSAMIDAIKNYVRSGLSPVFSDEWGIYPTLAGEFFKGISKWKRQAWFSGRNNPFWTGDLTIPPLVLPVELSGCMIQLIFRLDDGFKMFGCILIDTPWITNVPQQLSVHLALNFSIPNVSPFVIDKIFTLNNCSLSGEMLWLLDKTINQNWEIPQLRVKVKPL